MEEVEASRSLSETVSLEKVHGRGGTYGTEGK
jgi:hypothetical protein